MWSYSKLLLIALHQKISPTVGDFGRKSGKKKNLSGRMHMDLVTIYLEATGQTHNNCLKIAQNVMRNIGSTQHEDLSQTTCSIC